MTDIDEKWDSALLGAQEAYNNLIENSKKTSLLNGLEKTIEWFSKPENNSKYKSDLYIL